MKTPLPEELLGLLAPDPAAIFNRLRALISDRLLAVIAGADYGNEAEEHLRELKPIRDDGAVPAPVIGRKFGPWLLGLSFHTLRSLRFFSPEGAGWLETARQDLTRVISREASAGGIRAHYREQAKNLSIILRERMNTSPLARVAFELY